MTVLVTGSRKWQDRAAIQAALDLLGPISLLVHGDAVGADSIAGACAIGMGIPIVKFPANWNGDGKAAGPIRNRRMFDLVQPDVVLAFPLKDSIGTWDMVRYAESQGCPVILSGEGTNP